MLNHKKIEQMSERSINYGVRPVNCVRLIINKWDKMILMEDLETVLHNMGLAKDKVLTVYVDYPLSNDQVNELLIRILTMLPESCEYFYVKILIDDDPEFREYVEFLFEDGTFSMSNINTDDEFFNVAFFDRVKEIVFEKKDNETEDTKIFNHTKQAPRLFDRPVENDPSFYRIKF